jgi:hypothetical protein
MQRDLVLPPHLVLGRRPDGDFVIAQLGEQLGAARDLLAEGRGFRNRPGESGEEIMRR